MTLLPRHTVAGLRRRPVADEAGRLRVGPRIGQLLRPRGILQPELLVGRPRAALRRSVWVPFVDGRRRAGIGPRGPGMPAGRRLAVVVGRSLAPLVLKSNVRSGCTRVAPLSRAPGLGAFEIVLPLGIGDAVHRSGSSAGARAGIESNGDEKAVGRLVGARFMSRARHGLAFPTMRLRGDGQTLGLGGGLRPTLWRPGWPLDAPGRRFGVRMRGAGKGRSLRRRIGVRVDSIIGEGIGGDGTRRKGWKRLFLCGRRMIRLFPSPGGGRSLGLLSSSRHQRFVAPHAEDALRRPGISKVFDLALAVAAAKAGRAESLIPGQDGKVFDLVPARAAAVSTIVADERAIAEEEEVGIGVEESAAGVAAEAVEMPPVASCAPSVSEWQRVADASRDGHWRCEGDEAMETVGASVAPEARAFAGLGHGGGKKGVLQRVTYQAQKPCPLQGSRNAAKRSAKGTARTGCVPRVAHLAASLARENIVIVYRAIQILVHDGSHAGPLSAPACAGWAAPRRTTVPESLCRAGGGWEMRQTRSASWKYCVQRSRYAVILQPIKDDWSPIG